jgi:DNA invertase Pin-like site-specific DNA recombinase
MTDKHYIVALYLRLSLDDGYGESESISNQRKLLKLYISSRDELAGCEILEFADDGYTGTNFNRPAVTDMLNQAKNGKINCILVKDFSRFGRNHIEVGDYIEQIFPFLGIRFISVNNNFDSINYTMQAGTLDIAFTNLINDYYSKDVSKKVTSAKHAKMRKGDYMSTTALFGYRKMEGNKNRLEIDPMAAEYVRKVFNLCLGGKTSGAIALEMNRSGIPTPLVYKRINGYDRKWRKVNDTNHWTRAMVLKILRDERYIGSTISGKTRVLKVGSNQRLRQSKSEWVVVPDTHEPIISENVFNEAQALLGLKTERLAYGAKERLFAGKVKCGTCGHAMRGRYDRVRPFFFCETTKIHKTDCTLDKVYEDELCDMVLASIRLYAEMALCADSFFVQLRDNTKGDTAKIVANITSVQTDIEKAKSAKVALYESYKEGTLTRDMYIEEKKRNDAAISVLLSRMEKMKVELQALRGEETNNRFVDSFKSLGHLSELTPQLVSKLVAAIKIHDSHDIGITWNFEDDYQRVLRFC